ncbi:MAG: DNA-binding transcriptional LysR family regulator [Psychrosphaera sp.]
MFSIKNNINRINKQESLLNKEHKKLERLMLFSEVAQHLSFTVAASHLGISRGHLSAQIRRLEQDMGLPLLIRSTRSVRLTAEGERVLSGMNQIRYDLLQLERNAKNEGTAIEGVIKVTSPRIFTERYLIDIFTKFKKLHPKIEFSVDSSYTNYDLNRSDYDLAFRATNTPPENMIAKPVLTYQHCVCAAPQYLAKHGTPEYPNDLDNHQCLRGQDQPTWTFVGCEVKANGWLQINDNHLLKDLALSGQGIIRVAEYLVDREIEQGKLIQLFKEEMPMGLSIYMIHPQLIYQSNRLSAFIKFTQDYFN